MKLLTGFSWLGIGSNGRKNTLLSTIPVHALIEIISNYVLKPCRSIVHTSKVIIFYINLHHIFSCKYMEIIHVYGNDKLMNMNSEFET